MSCWVKSTGKDLVVRDGFSSDSPVMHVGAKPVYFEHSAPERFRGDKELEVLGNRKAPTKKELSEQSAEQDKLRAARLDKKRKNRRDKYAEPLPEELVAASASDFADESKVKILMEEFEEGEAQAANLRKEIEYLEQQRKQAEERAAVERKHHEDEIAALQKAKNPSDGEPAPEPSGDDDEDKDVAELDAAANG